MKEKKLHVFSQIMHTSLQGICSILFSALYFCVMSSTLLERCYNKSSKKFIIVGVERRFCYEHFFVITFPSILFMRTLRKDFCVVLKQRTFENFLPSPISSLTF